MKKRMIRTLSLAALVGMTAISAKTVRAEAGASLERDKQRSGVEFGEGEIEAQRRGFSAVSASGDGVSRAALTVGELEMKARRGRPEVPSPARTVNGNSGEGEHRGIKHALKVFRRDGLEFVGTFAVWGFWLGLLGVGISAIEFGLGGVAVAAAVVAVTAAFGVVGALVLGIGAASGKLG